MLFGRDGDFSSAIQSEGHAAHCATTCYSSDGGSKIDFVPRRVIDLAMSNWTR
jgi:hypothetical protein